MNKQVNNLLDLLEKNLPNANAFKEKIFNKTLYHQKVGQAMPDKNQTT